MERGATCVPLPNRADLLVAYLTTDRLVPC
jgi:hypothetical protein